MPKRNDPNTNMGHNDLQPEYAYMNKPKQANIVASYLFSPANRLEHSNIVSFMFYLIKIGLTEYYQEL